MTWFSASLFFKSERSRTKNEKVLWEESICLVRANTYDEALKKAVQNGRKIKVNYKTNEGDMLAWKFVKVERIFMIDENRLMDGTELFSRFLRSEEASLLLTPFDE
jgi:hypothetical protein